MIEKSQGEKPAASEPVMAATDVLHEDVTFASTDGESTCVGDLLMPATGTPRGVVQICHGMVEYIRCYEAFARELVKAGYAVCGFDQVGHGRTTPDPDDRGIYDHSTGADVLIEDQHVMRTKMQARFEGVPYFILGHSMGSFVARCYIGRHGAGLAGAIIMGTAWQPGSTIAASHVITSVIAAFHNWGYRSPFVDNIGVGGYNKEFEGTGAKTGYEWLSRDEARPVAYAADPDCGWMFSVSGYYVLADLLSEAEEKAAIAKVPKDLPILILSGADDPVGQKGEGPVKTFQAFQAAGITDVTLDLFDGARHELQNETCKDEVTAEIVEWLGKAATA